MAACPRLVVGATSSGAGKTSITLGIVAALRGRGLVVQAYKIGPDFLDPTYLAIASGRPCYNLDGWMMGRAYVEGLVARTSADADIVVIEGVMGLFDGAQSDSIQGSTAEIAKWLDAPILLVVNVHGMARSLAALVKGFASFEAGVNVAGVIVNWCGSEAHGAYLKESLASAALPQIVAHIPRGALPALSSRHLGLVTADVRTLPTATIDALAHAITQYASLDAILDVARGAPELKTKAPARRGSKERMRLGVAHDDAFHFYYEDFFDELEEHGCAVARFSPIADNGLPEGIDALYFGGGYPEEMAQALSENEAMRAAVSDFAHSGCPVYAECGGLMYLGQGLEKADGTTYVMTGILPAMTRMYERRQSLAYVEVTLKKDSLWGRPGDTVRGHEFHYSRLVSDPLGHDGWESVYSVKKRRSGPQDEGYQRGRVLASYTHLHLASHEDALQYFIDTCKGEKWKKKSKLSYAVSWKAP